ncbi:MAG: hypothetical protein AAFO82_15355 [Bacteroidota bacterium]
MRRTISFIIAFMLLLCYANAQYNISLSEYDIELDIPFQVSKIIDARADTSKLGITKVFSTGTNEALVFEREMAKELLSLFDKTEAVKQAQSLLLRINHLHLYEAKWLRSKYAYIELNMDFILEQEGQYYLLFRSILSDRSNDKLNVNKLHASNIKNVIAQSFLEFSRRYKEDQLLNKTINLDEKQEVAPTILKTSTYPKGLYLSFNDFKDNLLIQAETLQFKWTESNLGKRYLTALPLLRGEDAKYYEQGIWGFSDGENLFVKIGGNYHKLYRDEDRFFLKYMIPDEPSAGVYAAAILGGAVGGIVASLIEGKPIDTEDWELNLATGKLEPLASRHDALVIIHNYKFNPKKTTVDVEIEGVGKCTLNSKDAYTIYTQASELEVCVATNGERVCKTIIPILGETVVYDAIFNKKSGELTLETPYKANVKNTIVGMSTGKVLIVCENDYVE